MLPAGSHATMLRYAHAWSFLTVRSGRGCLLPMLARRATWPLDILPHWRRSRMGTKCVQPKAHQRWWPSSFGLACLLRERWVDAFSEVMVSLRANGMQSSGPHNDRWDELSGDSKALSNVRPGPALEMQWLWQHRQRLRSVQSSETGGSARPASRL